MPDGSSPLNGHLSSFDGKIYVYQGRDIREIDRQGRVLGTVSVPTDASGLGLVALPKAHFAVLDNRQDEVRLLDAHGELVETVGMLHEADNHLQNVHGIVVDDILIVSEDGNRNLLQVDLATHEVSVFREMADLRSHLGAMAHHEGTYYICTSRRIHAFTPDGEPRLITTLNGSNITGIAIRNNFAYVTANFAGKIYKIDLASGESSLFVDRLNYPDGIVAIPSK